MQAQKDTQLYAEMSECHSSFQRFVMDRLLTSKDLEAACNHLPLLQHTQVATTLGKDLDWLYRTINDLWTMDKLARLGTMCFHNQSEAMGDPITEQRCAQALIGGMPTGHVRKRLEEFLDKEENRAEYATNREGAFEKIYQKAQIFSKEYQPVVNSLRCLTSGAPGEEDTQNASSEDQLRAMDTRPGRSAEAPARNGFRRDPNRPRPSEADTHCWNCGEKGHYARNCQKPLNPNRLNIISDEELQLQGFNRSANDLEPQLELELLRRMYTEPAEEEQ